MTTQHTIQEKLKKFDLNSNSKFFPNKSAYVVALQRNGIEFELTIPLNVFELFLQAKDLKSGEIIEDWRDYYGSEKEKDYLDELEEILRILKTEQVRFSKDRNIVEYFKNGWLYFFG